MIDECLTPTLPDPESSAGPKWMALNHCSMRQVAVQQQLMELAMTWETGYCPPDRGRLGLLFRVRRWPCLLLGFYLFA